MNNETDNLTKKEDKINNVVQYQEDSKTNITNENIKQIEFKILAIDNYTVIVEWHLEQNFEIYDGIYEIKFNENLECIYFKSWEMKDVSN